jgi:hypothetical protein
MLAVLLTLCVSVPPSPANLVHLGPREMARHRGHVAYFVGTIGDLGGVVEIYTADLDTDAQRATTSTRSSAESSGDR